MSEIILEYLRKFVPPFLFLGCFLSLMYLANKYLSPARRTARKFQEFATANQLKLIHWKWGGFLKSFDLGSQLSDIVYDVTVVDQLGVERDCYFVVTPIFASFNFDIKIVWPTPIVSATPTPAKAKSHDFDEL